jgi:hypothetical protein
MGNDAYVETEQGRLFVQDISGLSNDWEEVEQVSTNTDVYGDVIVPAHALH